MSRDYWQVYKNKLNYNGSTQKDRLVANTQRIITDNFSNSPSYEVVTINDISQGVQIVDENSLFKNPNKKRIICKPDESIAVGDLVVWNSENWLCTDLDDFEIYDRGIIEKCNNNLIYLDSTGDTVTLPCIVIDRILMDSKENDYYILPNNEIWVMVDSNSDSTPIEVDWRFILGSNAYKVEAIDNITKSGLIIFKMCFDSIIEDDDVDLGIANATSRSHSYAVTILNGSEINLTLSNNVQLEVQATDNDEVVTSPSITYSLVTGATSYLTVSTSGLVNGSTLGTGKSVKASYNSTSDTLLVNIVTAATSAFVYSISADIQPQNEVKYQQNKIFEAHKKYFTGTEVTGSVFEFTVVLSTGASTSNYLLATSSDTSVTLKTLEYPFNITLVATDQGIPANSTSQVISLKGLI